MDLNLRIIEVQDTTARENFRVIQEELINQPILSGNWVFFEIEFEAAVSDFLFPHRLKFKPTDIIQTSLTGAGSLTWNYTDFTTENLSITTTDACIVRFLVGRID